MFHVDFGDTDVFRSNSVVDISTVTTVVLSFIILRDTNIIHIGAIRTEVHFARAMRIDDI